MRDGARVEVFASLGSAAEAGKAVELGAEEVGLLRTEFLFLDRAQLPDEDEQAETLREIAGALDGRPLVVQHPRRRRRRASPGAAVCRRRPTRPGRARHPSGASQRPEVLATQLRAILRVAAEYMVKAMLPMVATLSEMQATRALLDEERAATGIDAPLDLGIIVEIPAAALDSSTSGADVDFFSMGTKA